MGVVVISNFMQSMSRAFSTPTILGDGMLVRLRSTTIGILGIVAAVGLGLTAMVSQQGWPGVFGGPLPQAPTHLVENDPISVPRVREAAPPGGAHHASSPSQAPDGAAAGATHPSTGGRNGGSVAGNGPQATEPPRHTHPQPAQPQAEPTPTTAQPPTGEGPSTEKPPNPEAPRPSGGSPGRSGEPHGHSGEPHGHSAGPHGNAGEPPGHSGEAPGHSGESHGGHG